MYVSIEHTLLIMHYFDLLNGAGFCNPNKLGILGSGDLYLAVLGLLLYLIVREVSLV